MLIYIRNYFRLIKHDQTTENINKASSLKHQDNTKVVIDKQNYPYHFHHNQHRVCSLVWHLDHYL